MNQERRHIVQAEATEDELFNVVQYYNDGKWEELSSRVPLATAWGRFVSATNSIGARIGTVKQLLITDCKTESVCVDWQFGPGIVFPTRADCDAMAQGKTITS